MTSNAIKRIINKDMKELQKLNLDDMGIFINFDENNILNAKAIIIGPKNTPYENGILTFLISFPKDYPFNPPKISYISKSKNRIHPNLYVGRSRDNFLGKVCLSIINTWSGPKWTSIMHIGSVLLSIQSLLNENPLQNEPGFENETGIRNDNYNIIVLHDTYEYLILKNYFNIDDRFECFNEKIKENFFKNKESILKKLDDLCIEYPDIIKINSNIYTLSVNLNYPKIKNLILKNIINLNN